MKQGLFLVLSVFFVHISYSIPFIQEIYNDTEFIFEIIDHSSDSPCALFVGDINIYRIHPQETFYNPVILHHGDHLLLKPVAYFDKRQQEFIWFVDRDGDISEDGIEEAYQAWKYHEGKRRRMTREEWMDKWVGGQLMVSIKKEMYGYMLHILHAAFANNSHIDHAWPMYSQGVYSALGIVIQIKQDDRKGVMPLIDVVNDRGVLCENGEVVSI